MSEVAVMPVASGGDSERARSFSRWVVPELPVLAAIARRTVPAADAEDLVQETLERAWRRWETYDPARGSARVWLAGILFDRVRRRRARSAPPPHQSRLPASDAGPVSIADRVDIERAIDGLPTRQRELVLLYYLADLPINEVAGMLGITAGAAKSQLFDARTHLRAMMKDDQ
ncbi:RNA polymerase sigma-70 factor, ECF subfamily [Nakamurella panacisegetis]|uniref:RNA polymerase sigma-70 factor, ECF subfamily n=1 Tax=Nakamurella panacisegetis TaxID=1090615 RepID=A0A1H0MP58_9ACTN|nr:RNA polymerase sigma factor [Nakamurella panacisegetis]SDO82218.1 RNA polymerase sigma-70 factor, ECF subfamily [Nakamurella panacisegetis]